MRILILNDIHNGVTKESTSHLGVVRQANSQTISKLNNAVSTLSQQKFDLVLQLGDLIKELDNPEEDEKNLRETLQVLKKLPFPTLHVLGNHDLNAFSHQEITKIFDSENHDSDFFGVTQHSNFQIVRLGLKTNGTNDAILTTEKQEIIKKDLDPSKDTLVFSHYPIVPYNTKGTFYFDKPGSHEWMGYKNFDEIIRLFKKVNVRAFICAHVHFIGYRLYDNQHFISVPAFVENIAADEYPDNNPAVYSTLEIDSKSFVLKSYSGKFCFSNIEL